MLLSMRQGRSQLVSLIWQPRHSPFSSSWRMKYYFLSLPSMLNRTEVVASRTQAGPSFFSEQQRAEMSMQISIISEQISYLTASSRISSLWAMKSLVEMSKMKILSILQQLASRLSSLQMQVVQGRIFCTSLLKASQTEQSRMEVKWMWMSLLSTPSSVSFFLCLMRNSSLASWVVSSMSALLMKMKNWQLLVLTLRMQLQLLTKVSRELKVSSWGLMTQTKAQALRKNICSLGAASARLYLVGKSQILKSIFWILNSQFSILLVSPSIMVCRDIIFWKMILAMLLRPEFESPIMIISIPLIPLIFINYSVSHPPTISHPCFFYITINAGLAARIYFIESWLREVDYIIIMLTGGKLDTLRIGDDKKLTKELEQGQQIVLSVKLTKINNVNKKQERVLLLTTRNLYNILPDGSFMSLFSRIKRKIPYSNVRSMTVSRFGHEFVVHVDKEHDYRFSSPTMKMKIVETLVDLYCKYHNKKMALYYYDDLTLESYTTTIDDVDKNQKKIHHIEPLYLDAESLKQSDVTKAESKLIFKNQNATDSVNSFEEFELLKVLGRGAFGKVMLCLNTKNKKYYAVKSMRKENLIEKQHLQKTRTERILLQKAKHPFLVSLQFAFQTKQKIFFIMNFIRGGQMFTHLRKAKRFSEPRAKFYAAQVFIALKYLHDLGYVYRDLKPENILFDVDGYIKVSDYGLCKFLKPGEKTYSLVGTPDYVSPEVIINKGQTFTTDWWSFGILLYEMIYGSPPFYNRDHEKMFHDILNRELFFDNSKVESSPEAKDLIRSLLKKDPEKRLGAKCEDDIKNHPWFASIDFEKMVKKQYTPEFIPSVNNEIDTTNFDDEYTNEKPINSLVNTDILLLSKFEKEFEGINFSKVEEPTPTAASFGKKKGPG